ncbi:MAG: alpha/beta hydrolase [Solirubrobacterales bacterium]|nr:alpha/beta hydrolase [Solirubrobacterales bacterium]
MNSGMGERAAIWAARRLVRLLFALPDGLLAKLFGRPPDTAPELRPDAWAMGRVVSPIEDSRTDWEPVASRRTTEFLAAAVGRPVPGVTIEPRTVEGDGRRLDALLFTPTECGPSGPLLIHFHGGGWVQGSIRSHRSACAWLAAGTGVRVLSVEYRLAPEHPFPAQAEDALLAWRAVAADPGRFGAEPGRVGVIGDSAGAQMAAVLCLDLKAAGEPQPACQILIYPVTDCTGSMPSRETFGRGFYLTKARMDWFERCFVPAGEAADPRVSPLFAEDLDGLAPALVSVAVADPLRDEGVAYGEKLAAAGMPVTIDHMPMLHAWFNLIASRSSRKGHEVLAQRVNQLLG